MKPSSIIKEESTLQLSKKYHHYTDVFGKVKANNLPHHQPYDGPIDVQLEKEKMWELVYNLSPSELEVLQAYREEKLVNGFIKHSKSPASTPILFVTPGHLKHVICCILFFIS